MGLLCKVSDVKTDVDLVTFATLREFSFRIVRPDFFSFFMSVGNGSHPMGLAGMVGQAVLMERVP